jgi:hypothetical protein
MSSEDAGSISRWLIVLTGSDDRAAVDDAVTVLRERCFDRPVRPARSRLEHARGATSDEGEVALSAIHGFCPRVAAGQIPRFDERRDLGRTLATAAARKAAGVFRRPRLQMQAARALDRIIGREPTPAPAAMVADEVGHLLEPPPNGGYRTVATSLGCSTRNVECTLRNIRAAWLGSSSEGPTAEGPPDDV